VVTRHEGEVGGPAEASIGAPTSDPTGSPTSGVPRSVWLDQCRYAKLVDRRHARSWLRTLQRYASAILCGCAPVSLIIIRNCIQIVRKNSIINYLYLPSH
jgi:hypothetical protein